MSRKTVRVEIPENIDSLMSAFEKMLLRNDGSLPAVPPSSLPWTVAARLGVTTLPAAPVFTPPAPAATGGTRRIPEEMAAPMRALYPVLKREYEDFVVVRALTQSLGESVQDRLGLGVAQTVTTPNTARNLVGRAVKSLLAVFAGNENELETYGLKVVVGAAAVGRRKGAGTPPTV